MTIKDLAAKTGYSIGTVSRVLNNQSHVSNQARATILKAAEECGFRLNTNAKQLKQQHSNSILVICKGKSNELFDSLLVSIQARMAESGHPLIVDYVDETENVVQRALTLCPEKKPLAVLFLGGTREEFQEDFHLLSLPCVLVTLSAADLPFRNLSSVSSDDAAAARMAIDHLADLGHRKIALLGGELIYSSITTMRYNSCVETLQRRGIDFQPERDYACARYTYADAYRATNALLKKNGDFTALFAMSDVMAIGAIRALKDAGKRIPEDVSVIGLDGLEIGEYIVPRLATVAQNVELLAQKSHELLQQILEGGSGGRHLTVPVTLCAKESAKAQEA